MNFSFIKIAVLIFIIFNCNIVMAQILYDFNTESNFENWFTVNDNCLWEDFQIKYIFE